MNGCMMLFGQKTTPPLVIIRATASLLMSQARALSRPILGADSQTTDRPPTSRPADQLLGAGLMSTRIRESREQGALQRGQPWVYGCWPPGRESPRK